MTDPDRYTPIKIMVEQSRTALFRDSTYLPQGYPLFTVANGGRIVERVIGWELGNDGDPHPVTVPADDHQDSREDAEVHADRARWTGPTIEDGANDS